MLSNYNLVHKLEATGLGSHVSSLWTVLKTRRLEGVIEGCDGGKVETRKDLESFEGNFEQRMPAIPKNTGRLAAWYRPHIGRLTARYRPHIGRIEA